MSYAELGKSIGELVEKKQAAYGDSFGKSGEVMRILYPDGIPPGKMDDALTVIRVLDKLFRIATDRDALGESPWRDVAGYALLSVHRVESRGVSGVATTSQQSEPAAPSLFNTMTMTLRTCQWCGALFRAEEWEAHARGHVNVRVETSP